MGGITIALDLHPLAVMTHFLLGLAAFGAFNGASVGVLASLGYFGLYGVLPFALLGAAAGSFFGLLAAERISRFL